MSKIFGRIRKTSSRIYLGMSNFSKTLKKSPPKTLKKSPPEPLEDSSQETLKKSPKQKIWTKKSVAEVINGLFTPFDMKVYIAETNRKDMFRFYFRQNDEDLDEDQDSEDLDFDIIFNRSVPDYIEIIYLKSFNNGKETISGTKILNKFKLLGKKLKVKYIELYDDSSKLFNKCDVDLGVLEILTGDVAQSWYNKRGFVSSHHTNDVEYNTILRNRLFIGDIVEEIKVKIQSNIDLDEYLELLSEGIRNFEELTLHEVFIRLKTKYLLKGLQKIDEEKCHAINTIMMYIKEYLIQYDKTLKYIVQK